MKPNVLVIAGHDPSGGAGLQADIEAIHSLGGFAATLITGLTVQNSQNVYSFETVSVEMLERQAQALLDDVEFSAVKIGMTASPNIVAFIKQLLEKIPHVPVVLDPVLAAEAGGGLATEPLNQVLLKELSPLSAVLTPNFPEAQLLSAKETLNECGETLFTQTQTPILITGTHRSTDEVENVLFSAQGKHSWTWERLPGAYHGSGCTLSSAIAYYLASGLSLTDAIEKAQEYVHSALRRAWRSGKGQFIPERRRES